MVFAGYLELTCRSVADHKKRAQRGRRRDRERDMRVDFVRPGDTGMSQGEVLRGASDRNGHSAVVGMVDAS